MSSTRERILEQRARAHRGAGPTPCRRCPRSPARPASPGRRCICTSPSARRSCWHSSSTSTSARTCTRRSPRSRPRRTAPAQVRAWAEMQARRNPRIAAVARALDQTRHADDPAATAWRDRTANRLRAASGIVERLRREGHVHRSWTNDEASRARMGASLVPGVGRPGERGRPAARALRRDRDRGRAGGARGARPPRRAPGATVGT